jgi:acetyl-CoA carboxylase carboxyltransferase component
MSDHVVHVQKNRRDIPGRAAAGAGATGEVVTAKSWAARRCTAQSGVSDTSTKDDAQALQIVLNHGNLPAKPKSEIPRRPVVTPQYAATKLYGIVPRRLATPYDARVSSPGCRRQRDSSITRRSTADAGLRLGVHPRYQVGILANNGCCFPTARSRRSTYSIVRPAGYPLVFLQNIRGLHIGRQ